MAPLDFKHMTSAKYRPGEDDAINYYAQKRKKQYHGNEGKEVKELSMKPDKKLPNLKLPVKGKKGVSKYMRKKGISQMKDAVQSADRRPEKYMKPDGKIGIRMVRTDKEVIKKESTIVDPRDLRGRPKKADPNPESKYGIKHPLHPANVKKAKKEATTTDAERKAMADFIAKGKMKKLPPGKAAGYHGKSDPGSSMKGMISPADTKQFGTKKKVGSMK